MSTRKQRLIMVMGLQRSGTNALFRSLQADTKLTAFNEHADSPLYLRWYLRPEPEIRAVLKQTPGDVLLKPISETFRRSVEAVFEDFAAYDVWLPWIYRDPVNVHDSQRRRWPDRTDVPTFIREWKQRNQAVLTALPRYGDRIGLVRYEDLISDPGVFQHLCRFFKIDGTALFRADSNGGRRHLPPAVIATIEEETAAVGEALDAARRFLPNPARRMSTTE